MHKRRYLIAAFRVFFVACIAMGIGLFVGSAAFMWSSGPSFELVFDMFIAALLVLGALVGFEVQKRDRELLIAGSQQIRSDPIDDRHIGEVGASTSFELADWREMDRLVRHLKKHRGGKVKIKAEGPDARTFVISFPAGKMVIYQWDTDDVAVFVTPGLEEIAAEIRAQYGGSEKETQRF
jgi:hypothetical protein